MLGAAILARAWRGPREPAVTSGEQAFIQEGALVPPNHFWNLELQIRKERRTSVAIIHDTPASRFTNGRLG